VSLHLRALMIIFASRKHGSHIILHLLHEHCENQGLSFGGCLGNRCHHIEPAKTTWIVREIRNESQRPTSYLPRCCWNKLILVDAAGPSFDAPPLTEGWRCLFCAPLTVVPPSSRVGRSAVKVHKPRSTAMLVEPFAPSADSIVFMTLRPSLPCWGAERIWCWENENTRATAEMTILCAAPWEWMTHVSWLELEWQWRGWLLVVAADWPDWDPHRKTKQSPNVRSCPT